MDSHLVATTVESLAVWTDEKMDETMVAETGSRSVEKWEVSTDESLVDSSAHWSAER